MSTEDFIDGVTLIPLSQLSDVRGSVLHFLRNDASDFTHFGECYFSEIMPGAVKAWKRHRVQTQNLTVPVGRVQIVIYDARGKSPTAGRVQIFELGRPDAYARLRIPPGLWYGFRCRGEKPALLVNCPDFPHNPAEGEKLAEDDSEIPYRW